jgi:hypothetical protein
MAEQKTPGGKVPNPRGRRAGAGGKKVGPRTPGTMMWYVLGFLMLLALG